MKILHLGKYYPPYLGGMETVLRHLAEGLLDRSCEVTVLTAGDGPEEILQDLTGPVSGQVGQLVRAPVFGHTHSQPLTLTLAGILRREIVNLGPDLVHLHLPNPLAAATWLSLGLDRSLDLPQLAVWYHADITRQRLGRILMRPVVARCLAQASGISVSSAVLADGSPILSPWRPKVEVIPFGIDPSPWIDLPAKLDGPFLFVGRLVPYKGLDVLLRAMALATSIDLVIVGEGPLEGELKAQAENLQVADRVRFAGPMDEAGVADHLARARALVLPSLDVSETFGLVQLEAMASGVPVVATDIPTGVREVGDPGRTCLLVPPGDSAALAGALGSLQDDPSRARQMGEGGRRLFQKRYTREMMIDRLLRWYDSLLKAKRGGSA